MNLEVLYIHGATSKDVCRAMLVVIAWFSFSFCMLLFRSRLCIIWSVFDACACTAVRRDPVFETDTALNQLSGLPLKELGLVYVQDAVCRCCSGMCYPCVFAQHQVC